jgi:signal transduction histidine kinase
MGSTGRDANRTFVAMVGQTVRPFLCPPSISAGVSVVTGLLALLIGLVGLCGWIFDSPALKSVFPTLVAMKANTAVGFILSGIALLILNKEPGPSWPRTFAQMCSGGVALLGGVTLCQDVFGIDLHLDQLLFTEPVGTIGTLHPGRMAPATAFNFFLIGIGLLLTTGKFLRPARILFSLVGAVAFFSILGYLLDIDTLYRLGSFRAMAVHTAFGFFFLAASYLAIRVDVGPKSLIFAGFLMAIVILLFIVAATAWRMVNQMKDVREVIHVHQVLGRLEALFSNVKDIESGGRGFALMGEVRFLGPYEVILDGINQKMTKLDDLVQDNPRQQKRVAALKPVIAAKIAFMKNIIRLRKEKGMQVAINFIHTMKGVQVMEEIRVRIDEMKEEENRLLANRTAAMETSSRSTIFTTLIGNMVGIILLSLVFMVLFNENRRRLLAEQTLHRANEDLERRVQDRTADLVRANTLLQSEIEERKRVEAGREALVSELETKNAELERFTYIVAHDLKSPLITIKGFLGFLAQDMETGNVEQLKEDAARIVRAADKMQQMLGELLKLSRIGRMDNPPSEIPLGDLVREALLLLEGPIKQRGVVVEVASDLPSVYGDAPRLFEVVQNLIDNAVKFMGDQPEPRVQIGVREAQGERVFFVKDNGIGVDTRYQEKIFGLFEKLNQTGEGSGIGLAIVKRIVEVHGGRLWVESAGSCSGSTFCFTLPGVKTVK